MNASSSRLVSDRYLALVCAGAIALLGCGGGNAADDSLDNVDVEQPDGQPLPDAEPPPPVPDAEPPPAPDAIISFACTLEELQPILGCAQEACLNDLTAECLVLNCGLLLFGLSDTCRDCALAAIGSGGDLGEIAGACISGPDLGGLGGLGGQ